MTDRLAGLSINCTVCNRRQLAKVSIKNMTAECLFCGHVGRLRKRKPRLQLIPPTKEK